MKLLEFFSRQPPPLYRARDALGKKCGTSGEYLRLVASGHRLASPALAKRINRATKGVVLLHDIRPDIWDKPKRRAPDASSEEKA
jgi:DNA-binding transcriptional regulator YdaS (Cro superfamily)